MAIVTTITPREAYFGSPETQAHEPNRTDLVDILQQCLNAVGLDHAYAFPSTTTELAALTGMAVDNVAVVTDTAENGGGFYQYDGVSWVFQNALPLVMTETLSSQSAMADRISAEAAKVGSEAAEANAAVSEANAQIAKVAAELAESNAVSAAIAAGAVFHDDAADMQGSTSPNDFGYILEGGAVAVYKNISGTATFQDWLVKPSGIESFIVSGVNSGNSAAINGAAIKAAISANAGAGGVFVVPKGAPVDWAAADLQPDEGTAIFGPDGELIIGEVGLQPAGEQNDHVVFQSRRANSTATRVYIQPPEPTLGHTEVTDGVVTSATIFFDAYDAQGLEADTNADWTGPHYRDGGVSAFVGPTLTPDYSPAGIIAFNAKTGGNWWPFRPSSGLSVSEKPMATVFELPTSPALAGPTFAGGGVYPTDKWRPSKIYSAGDICHEYGRVYEVTTGGTSGTTPPMHDGAGGARADAWDASILTTAGTLTGGFYSGTDGGTGGGTVQYALIEQLYPMDADNVLLLGPSLSEDPLLGLDDGAVQIGAPTYLISDYQIVAAKREADGSGTTNNCGLHSDFNGAMFFGYGSNNGLQARYNSTDNLHFNGVSTSYSTIVKSSGTTTVDVSGVSIVKFNDAAATNFTGFTNAKDGQVVYLLFNNTNTTLKHSLNFRCPGGADITPDSNDGYTVVMRNDSTAQVMG